MKTSRYKVHIVSFIRLFRIGSPERYHFLLFEPGRVRGPFRVRALV